MGQTMDVPRYLSDAGARVDAYLDANLPPASTGPGRLHDAIRYCVFSGGKRFRPAVALAACEAFGGQESACLPGAAGVELIHVSSLIHDDLPCMDDSDLRRGKPACHRAFDEATAVLVGDWLLTRPFELLSLAAEEGALPLASAAAMVHELSRAVCTEGIVDGQVADLDAEGRRLSLDELRRLHSCKTGALIAAAARCGLVAAGVKAPELAERAAFATHLGLGFQVVDDILDVTGDEASLGKPVGADDDNDKCTYVSLLGLDGAREMARQAAAEAHACLDALPAGAEPAVLHALVDFVICRER
jgi:geranylgeranyl diphosphate synthase, type II